MANKKAPDHPSEDRTGRFPVDALLRANGFAICRREGRKEPVWVKNRVEHPEHDALLRLDQSEVADAAMAEELYYDGFC